MHRAKAPGTRRIQQRNWPVWRAQLAGLTKNDDQWSRLAEFGPRRLLDLGLHFPESCSSVWGLTWVVTSRNQALVTPSFGGTWNFHL